MNFRQLKILWLKTGPLHPLDTGGKIRTYNMLKELKKKHHITYIALAPLETKDENKQKAVEYCQEAIWIPWEETSKDNYKLYIELFQNMLFSDLPYAVQKYQSLEMQEYIERLDCSGNYDIIICDFLIPSVNIKKKLATPSVLFQHNVESLIWKRRYDNAKGIKRVYLYNQRKRMEQYEQKGCMLFDGVATVSVNDSDILKEEFGLTNIIGDVPTGVDTSYFKPIEAVKRRGSIVFSGSMDWDPNEDAVLYFVKEIYPLIKEKAPYASFTVVGRNPSQRLKSLNKLDSSINITGTVEDVRPYLTESEVYVVPLRIGGGTRIKIFEAMAMALPVVSTSIGAEGLSVKNGENILLSDQPEEFADNVIKLLQDQKNREEIGEKALTLIQKRFSWGAVTEVFETLCQHVIKERKAN
jgi:glycosyltransferase involved in cell wall biosynthesis